MTYDEATETIDRLVADLARATGRSENLIRLSYGLELDLEPQNLTPSHAA
jgi:hypothetical protein